MRRTVVHPEFSALESRVLLSASALPWAIYRPPINPVTGPELQLGLGSGVGSAKTTGKIVLDDIANTLSSPRWLALGSAGAAQSLAKIDYAGDLDVFALVAAVSGNMTVFMAGSGKSAISASLTACDATGAVVGQDVNSADPTASVSFAVVAGKTYYLKASSLNSNTGGYTLSLSTAVAPTPVDPDSPTPMSPDPVAPSVTPAGSYTPQAAIAVSAQSIGGVLHLVVLGTDGNDAITISQTAASVTVVTSAGSSTYSGSFSKLDVYGFGGNDTIRLAYSVTAGSLIFAGAGNDTVYENSAGLSQVYGGAGDDLLVTVGGGADAAWGEAGADSFWVDSADAIGDAEAAEVSRFAVHRIANFYQPANAAAIPLDVNGQNIADPAAPTATGSAYTSFANRPLFVDGPDANDMFQGNAQDCYFLAGLASLCNTNPEIIRQMVTSLGDGSYAVRFIRGGIETFVRVDAELSTFWGRLNYAKLTPDGEIWVAIAEKAYAVFRTGANAYSSLDYGWMDAIYSDITGAAATKVSTAGQTAAAMAQLISSNLSSSHAVSAATSSSATDPLAGLHAYSVQAVEQRADGWYVTVLNPWGQDGNGSWDSNPMDGFLVLPMSMFLQNFSTICVSRF